MATVKLRKALQIKNRLAGEVREVTARILASNHMTTLGEKPEFDVRAMMLERAALVSNLVAVKTAIAVANVPIYAQISHMAELKSQAAMLSGLNTFPVLSNKRVLVEGRYDYLDVRQEPIVTAKEVQEEVKVLNKAIEDLQDTVDYHNSVTDVVVPD